MPSKKEPNEKDVFVEVWSEEPTHKDEQIEKLQDSLTAEQDARREERFIFIVIATILLNVVFFSVLDGLGGPIALTILELLILIPLARRMGNEEIAQMLDRTLNRVTGNLKEDE